MESRDDVKKIRIGAMEQLGAIPRVLKELQELVPLLSVAYSTDGRTFGYEAPLSMPIPVGSYVALSVQNGGEYLGQLVTKEVSIRQGAEIGLELDPSLSALLPKGISFSSSHTYPLQRRYAYGSGVILGRLDGGRYVPTTSEDGFQSADLTPASGHLVAQYLAPEGRATLDVGRALYTEGGVRALVGAEGFDRHTFLCGQSGSGKSYALGVILERLLMETDLRIVILDPNSDFVRLTDVRDGADADAADRYREAARSVSVHSGRDEGERRLRIRFGEIDPAAHAELIELLDEGRVPSVAAFEATTRPGARQLALRARNLGLERMGVWAGEQSGSTLQAIHEPAARTVVVGLGTLATQEEQALTAGAVLAALWRRREDRNPVLVVIDEAHNVCPAVPQDPLTALATSHAIRIAAEGRKFGLYLLASTQRPQKVHENVVSQCDNLVLMRLNSAADSAFVQSVFSFMPPRLVAQAASFRLGEALVVGKISPNPALVRFGARVAEEGGSDVPATWAAATG